MIDWHRLFGLTLEDYFTGTLYTVELEKDVARKRQVLDVVIVRGPERGAALADPCDGLEDLKPHNLLTYKSGQESLDAWAIDELIGHYVNYRKAFAPREPTHRFGLYAVTTRRPRALAHQVTLEPVKLGVYHLPVVGRMITLIVLREVETCPRNALWSLFSFEAARVALGAESYRWRQDDHLPILETIYQRYRETGIPMSYTFEDFRHDYERELLKRLPPEERLRGLPPEELTRRLTPEERLRGLPPEELARRLPPEERLRGLPPEDRLRGLSDAELDRLAALLARRKSGQH
jgi:hypothetical protein